MRAKDTARSQPNQEGQIRERTDIEVLPKAENYKATHHLLTNLNKQEKEIKENG